VRDKSRNQHYVKFKNGIQLPVCDNKSDAAMLQQAAAALELVNDIRRELGEASDLAYKYNGQ
jgi:hypothetical protein